MNMYDYLKWRGDLSFAQDGFNIVDNLLFSYACYTDLSEVIKEDETITLKEAAERYFETHKEEEVLKSGSFIAHAPVILRRMGESNRFGDVKMSGYIRNVDKSSTEQFSAVCFEYEPRKAYIAFCGTDDTIIGWKEDFQMSYKVINAQKKAVKYLNSVAKKPFFTYNVGGHSKGGTLAVYAAMKANKNIRKKLINVYSNDGPGLSGMSMDQEAYDSIKSRIIKIIPEFCIVGLLFDNEEDNLVIKSDKALMMQHDAVSWQILGTHFEEGKLAKESLLIHQGLFEFLNSMDISQREKLVTKMFETFDKAGIENTTDFTQKGFPLVIKFLKEVVSVDESARQSFIDLLSVFGKLASEKAGNTIRQKVKETTDQISELLNRDNKKDKSQ